MLISLNISKNKECTELFVHALKSINSMMINGISGSVQHASVLIHQPSATVVTVVGAIQQHLFSRQNFRASAALKPSKNLLVHHKGVFQVCLDVA